MASLKHAMQLFCEQHKDEIIGFHRSFTAARFTGAPFLSQRQFIVQFLESKRHLVVETDPLGRNKQSWPVREWLLPTFEFVFKKWVTKFVLPVLALENTTTAQQAEELDELLTNTLEAIADGSDLTQQAMEFGVPPNTFRAMLRQAAKRRPELDEKLKEALDDSYENEINNYRVLLMDPAKTPAEKALAKEALQAKRLVVEQIGSRFGVNNNPQGHGGRGKNAPLTGIAIDFTYGDTPALAALRASDTLNEIAPSDHMALPALPPLPELPGLEALAAPPQFTIYPGIEMREDARP